MRKVDQRTRGDINWQTKLILEDFSKNIFPGKFVVFDGFFLSGKTIAREVFEYWLKKQKLNYVSIENNFNFLESPMSILTERLKAILCQEIIPELKKGKVVIVEKYIFSSIAYKLSKYEKISRLLKSNLGLVLPDLTFLFNLKPGKAMKRLSIPLFVEKEDFYRKKFLEVATIFSSVIDIQIINANRPIPEIWDDMTEIFYKKFLKKTI